jgi:hypothetical protein
MRPFLNNPPASRRRLRLLFPLLFIGVALLTGGLVMFLWNAILPDVTGVRPLNYWQALGILVLSRLLFGRFSARRPQHWKHHRQWRDKWANLSDEERQQLRQTWENRCRNKSDN